MDMSAVSELVWQGIRILIDIASIVMAFASVLIVLAALRTSVSQRGVNWGMPIFMVAILVGGSIALKVVPPLYMQSARIGLSNAHDESVLLADEVKGWNVGGSSAGGGGGYTNPTVTPTSGIAPTATAVPVTYAPTLLPSDATAVVVLTPTLAPTSTPVPSPTAVPTLDAATWNFQTPPPTPTN